MRTLFADRDLLHSQTLEIDDRSHEIWRCFKSCQNRCASILRLKMVAYYAAKTATTLHNKFWPFYKSIIKTKKHASTTPSNITDALTNNSVSNPKSVADTFNRHFTNIKIDSIVSAEDSILYVNKFFNQQLLASTNTLRRDSFSFSEVTPLDVIDAALKLDPSSSSGVILVPVKSH